MRNKLPLPTLFLLCGLGLVGCSDGTESRNSSTESVAKTPPAPASTRPSGQVSDWKGNTTTLPKIALCSVDAINANSAADGAFIASVAQPLSFDGWLSTPDMRVPGDFFIVLAGASTFAITATTAVIRDDVVKAYSAPALQNSGFHVEVSAPTIPAGEYAISLVQTVNGEEVACDSLQKLQIK